MPDDELFNEEIEDEEQYDDLLLLEQLESIEEEMQEVGVTTLEEVRAKIAEINSKLDQE